MAWTEIISAGIGLVIPALIALLKQTGLDKRWNLLIALATCAAAGTLTAWGAGELTGVAVAAAIGSVFTAATATYKLFWQDWLGGLAEATSIIKDSSNG